MGTASGAPSLSTALTNLTRLEALPAAFNSHPDARIITSMPGLGPRTPRTARPLHLPRDWPWEPGLDELFRHALHDPLPAAA